MSEKGDHFTLKYNFLELIQDTNQHLHYNKLIPYLNGSKLLSQRHSESGQIICAIQHRDHFFNVIDSWSTILDNISPNFTSLTG